MKRALDRVFRQVPRHAHEPSFWVIDAFASLPTFPEPQKRLLSYIEREVAVEPAGISHRPHRAAVML